MARRLNQEEIAQIRRLREDGLSIRAIGGKVVRSKATIHGLVRDIAFSPQAPVVNIATPTEGRAFDPAGRVDDMQSATDSAPTGTLSKRKDNRIPPPPPYLWFRSKIRHIIFPISTLILGVAVSGLFWSSRPVSNIAGQTSAAAPIDGSANASGTPPLTVILSTAPTCPPLTPTPTAAATSGSLPLFGTTVRTPTPVLSPSTSNSTLGAREPIVHVVASGENLFRIALRYGTTVDVIAMRNYITDTNSIQAGQILIIP